MCVFLSIYVYLFLCLLFSPQSGRAPIDYAKELKERYQGERETILELITNEENMRMKKNSKFNKKSIPKVSKKEVQSSWLSNISNVGHNNQEEEDEEEEGKSLTSLSPESIEKERQLYNACGNDQNLHILEHYLGELPSSLEEAGGERGVNVNCKPYDAQRTPLHQAAFCGALECANCLLEWGAHVDEQDYVYTHLTSPSLLTLPPSLPPVPSTINRT